VNRRTPSPCGTHASAESSPPTPDKGVRGVTLGIYGDGPLEVRSGVVAPAGYYIVIDRAAGDQYEAAQGFLTWYGPYGAEHYMWAGSIVLDHLSGSLAKRCRYTVRMQWSALCAAAGRSSRRPTKQCRRDI
jgi:hypothetical protein